MKLRNRTVLLLLGLRRSAGTKTNGNPKLVSAAATAPEPSANSYNVLGPRQNKTLWYSSDSVIATRGLSSASLFRATLESTLTRPEFHLHVPTGYTSANVHAPAQRSVLSDSTAM